jgi:germination protein M
MSAQCLSLLSIVNTMTALEEIDRVEITVEGKLLIRYGALSIPGPLVLDERCVGPVRTALGEIEAVLYLVHGSQGLLIPIPARLRPGTSTTIPELVVKSLLSDPGTNGIRSCISPGTRLLSAKVEDGICTVDLSGEYLNQPENLDWSNRVLVASLCAIEGVAGVKILVNGSVPAEFEGTWNGILTPIDTWFL